MTRHAYAAGVAVALLTAVLNLWVMVVRDDGSGAGTLALVLAAAAGAFVARGRAAEMARAMVAMAVMQVLLGIAQATAPIVQRVPGGTARALVSATVFAALWLGAAALFRATVRRNEAPG